MRFVTIPAPVVLLNTVEGGYVTEKNEDSATPVSRSFDRVVRILCAVLVQRPDPQTGRPLHDAQTIRDIQAKFADKGVGDVVALSEEEWKLGEGELRKPQPQNFGTFWILCGEDHMRAWLDAPTKDPRGAAVKADSAPAGEPS